MRKVVEIEDKILGKIELREPSFAEAQVLFEQGKDVKFGLELIKLSVYRDGKRLLDDPELSLSEGQAALALTSQVLEICGFGDSKK